MAETTQEHGRIHRVKAFGSHSVQYNGKICVVPVCPVSHGCVSMSQQLPFCYGMAQKMAGSGVSILGLHRTHLIATAISVFVAFFFFSSNLSAIFARESWYQIMDGRSCGKSGGNRFGFFPSLWTCFCQSCIHCCQRKWNPGPESYKWRILTKKTNQFQRLLYGYVFCGLLLSSPRESG